MSALPRSSLTHAPPTKAHFAAWGAAGVRDGSRFRGVLNTYSLGEGPWKKRAQVRKCESSFWKGPCTEQLWSLGFTGVR